MQLEPKLWVPHEFLGYAELFGGRTADALAEFERAVRVEPNLPPLAGAPAYAYGASGQLDSARRVLSALKAESVGKTMPSGLALAYLGIGDRKNALYWLGRGADEQDPWLYEMSLNPPVFDVLRADPQFVAIVRPRRTPIGGSSRPS